jgi:hypothetical protein
VVELKQKTAGLVCISQTRGVYGAEFWGTPKPCWFGDSNTLSFAKSHQTRFWNAEIRQFAETPKTSKPVGGRVTGIPEPPPLHGHTGATMKDGERAGERTCTLVSCNARSMVVRTGGAAGLRRKANVAMM